VKNHRFEILLALVLAAILVVFSIWHTPGEKMSAEEVEHFMAKLEGLPWEDQEAGQMRIQMRAWAEADDGRPVYMLNLMRYYDELRPLPGLEGFEGSPQEANDFYEKNVMPILQREGGYPLFMGSMQGTSTAIKESTNLITFDPMLDNWDSVLIIRYPSRRAFFNLVTDPVYQKYVPYKNASVLVALVPMNGEIILPLLQWGLAAVLLVVFLACAWLHSLRRSTRL
jgi:hypothetical protein